MVIWHRAQQDKHTDLSLPLLPPKWTNCPYLFPLWSQLGTKMWHFCYLSLLLMSCITNTVTPGTAGLARLCSPKEAQYSLWLSLRSNSLSHCFSLTSCEIQPFLVALSVTSVSFSLCSLLCSAAPCGLLSSSSLWPGHTYLPAHNSFLPEVISAWEKQLHSSCHINDILVATFFWIDINCILKCRSLHEM